MPPWRSGARCRRATRVAGSPAARLAAATRTTSSTGPTAAQPRLDNLVLLCRRHHRAVHEGGFTVALGSDGTTSFLRPDRSAIDAAPALPVSYSHLDANRREPDDIPVWDGTPFDLVYAIEVLYAPRTPSVLVKPGS